MIINLNKWIFLFYGCCSLLYIAAIQPEEVCAQQQAQTAEIRAGRITYWMDQNLNLTEAQYEQIKELNLKYARTNAQLNKTYKESRLKLARKLKRSNRRKERKLRRILNHEQWELYVKGKHHLMTELATNDSLHPDPLAEYIKVHKNKIYARHKEGETYLNTLDVYTRTDFVKRPVVVYAHGGAWRMGDKRRTYQKLPAFIDSGYVFVAVNYRLSPAVKHPAHVQDLASAIKWIQENIRQFGGDPKQLILMGHSAGANMVMQVVTDHSYLNKHNIPVEYIKGVIGLDGAGYDITEVFESNHRRMKKIYKKAFGSNPEVWQNASPVHHIDGTKYLPHILLVHAGRREISEKAARELASQLRKVQANVTVRSYPHENHSSINKKLGLPDFSLTHDVFEFMASTLRKSNTGTSQPTKNSNR